MKRIIILAAMVFTGMLFAGCTKDSMDNLNTTAITNTNTTKNATEVPPVIMYNLAAEPAIIDRVVVWNAGYMTIGELIFEGTHLNGNMLSMQQFETNTSATVKLFEPVQFGLGIVTAQPNSFNSGMFTLQLDPADSRDAVNTVPAFFLSGTYYLDNIEVPVQVTINEQVPLSAEWINNVTVTDFKTYTALLSMNLNNITENITPQMIANAQQTNGVILISSSSNQNLYGVILSNLENNVLQVQFSLQAPTASPTPVPVKVTPLNS